LIVKIVIFFSLSGWRRTTSEVIQNCEIMINFLVIQRKLWCHLSIYRYCWKFNDLTYIFFTFCPICIFRYQNTCGEKCTLCWYYDGLFGKFFVEATYKVSKGLNIFSASLLHC
jgi:hypothetical protein